MDYVKILEERCFVVCIKDQRLFVFEAKGGLHLKPKPEYSNTFNPDPDTVVSTHFSQRNHSQSLRMAYFTNLFLQSPDHTFRISLIESNYR